MKEETLVARSRRGDEAAYAELVAVYQAAIYGLCYRVLGDADEAEDAAQETFLRAYYHLQGYDSARPFKTWLCAIAHHHCIDLLRRRRIAWLSLEADPPLQHPALRDSAPGPDEVVQTREHAAFVRRLLAQLGPQARAVVVMHYWSDLSYIEIAEATGTTVSAVKSRLHRARAALAHVLRTEAPQNQPAPRARPAWRPEPA